MCSGACSCVHCMVCSVECGVCSAQADIEMHATVVCCEIAIQVFILKNETEIAAGIFFPSPYLCF